MKVHHKLPPPPSVMKGDGCGGLMVSALDSGSKGLGSSPGQVIVLFSWAPRKSDENVVG